MSKESAEIFHEWGESFATLLAGTASEPGDGSWV